MHGKRAAESVFIFGPADLATTAIVDALRGRGIDAARAVELSQISDSIPPGVAVVDVSERAEAMRVVGAALADGWQVVVLSGDRSAPRVAAAVAQGAAAWLSTKVPVVELAELVRRLRAGHREMTDGDRAEWRKLHESSLAAAEQLVAMLDSLTDREFGVLRALERDLRAAVIADMNVVSIATIRSQIRSILRKLNVHSQEEAIGLYRRALAARNDRG